MQGSESKMREACWQCFYCGYLYDEALGDPERGITPGTPFADLPLDWICPGCGADPSDFQPAPAVGALSV